MASALPPEHRLETPRQTLHAPQRRARPMRVIRRIELYIGRIALIALTAAITGYGLHEAHGVMTVGGGLTLSQWVFLVLFGLSFGWVAFSAAQVILGFPAAVLHTRRQRLQADASARTAILIPVYNEEPARIAAAVEAMSEALGAKEPGRFAVFLLSDTNRAETWIGEEAVFSRLIAAASPDCPVHYRRRPVNTEKKAGNVAEWVERWGGAYETMLVLDADSVMGAGAICELARRMEGDPGLGLLQTIPRIVRARTLFGRLQQFANRCYGPVFAAGLGFWHGREANYWGHNAIIRTRAFAESAKLPILPGNPPFGGPVMSHDFIEAALMRRAGWRVELAPDIVETYEEAPPALSDVIIRDRRWCQGNLQHVRFLFARGITVVSRIHLLMGIMSYASALIWLLLIATGLVIAVQAGLTEPDYFAEPGLFPTWPVFDSERAVSLFIVAMAVVLTPKLLGWLSVMLRPRRLMQYGGPVAFTLSVLVETVLSALYAPVMMLAQANIILDILLGRDAGWRPQRRDDGAIAFTAAWRAHVWHFVTGLVLAGLTATIEFGLFLWTLPVTAGLVLAPLLSWISGMRSLGLALKRVAVLRTPEEQRRAAPALDAVVERLERWRALPPAATLPDLLGDESLLGFHLAQLKSETGALDDPGVLARERLTRAATLEEACASLKPAELMAVLNSAALLDQAAALPRRGPAAAVTPIAKAAKRS
ncbi:MAG: glucans biosynthesis glucosyltransferase MdoH [Oceanicaulis sp.]